MPVIVGMPMTVKFAALVTKPAGVVTVSVPVVVPAATTATICVSLETIKLEAAVPLNVTAVAPVNAVPVIVTLVPTGPVAGVKLRRVGAGTTVKTPVLVADPTGVVTLMYPLVVPAAITAVTWVSFTTLTPVAAVPFTLTLEVPVRPLPLMVTVVPTGPLVGVKLEIEGVSRTVKTVALVTEPLAALTVIRPVVVPAGTTAVIWFAELTVTLVAAVPLKLTVDEPSNPLPVITTDVPTGPLAGAKDMIDGVTVKLAAVVTVPPVVTTVIGPVVAPPGTVVVTVVGVLPPTTASTPLK